MLFAFGNKDGSYYVSHGEKNFWTGMPSSISSSLDDDYPLQAISFGEDGAWFYKEAPRSGTNGAYCMSSATEISHPGAYKVYESDKEIAWVAFGPDGAYVLLTEDGTWHWMTDIVRKYKNGGRLVPMRCVSFGCNGAWVIVEDDGEVRSHGLSSKIKKALNVKAVRNIQLSPHVPERFFIEYADGDTDWNLPPGAGSKVGEIENMPVRIDDPGAVSPKDVSQKIIFAFGHKLNTWCISNGREAQWRGIDDDNVRDKLKLPGKMDAFALGENGACFWKQGGSTWVTRKTEMAYPEVWRIWKSDEVVNWVAFGPQGYYIVDTNKRIYASRKSDILRNYSNKDKNQVPLRCASFGYGCSWVVIEDDGVIRSHGLAKNVLREVRKKSVRNVQLSITDPECYFIEYMDGKTIFHLPKSWHEAVQKVSNSGSSSFSTNSKQQAGILELKENDILFLSVVEQFRASWRHTNKRRPTIRKVYKVKGKADSISAYNSYRKGLERKGLFTANDLSEGNEQRRWHGTKRTCRLGDPGYSQLCSDTECSLCSIIRSSFDLNFYGGGTGWGRFGRGIYTSSTSSKSDDYSKNTDNATSSKYKTMLLNWVAVGRGYKTYSDMDDLTSPPAGFDSVLGEVGSNLNYDELVVYRNDAIMPAYLIVYE